MDVKQFAQMILDAQRIREESYDTAASEAATKAAEARKEADPDNIYAGLVDYSQFYRMRQLAAAQAACKNVPEMAVPVYLLCESAWNEIQDWATEMLGRGSA